MELFAKLKLFLASISRPLIVLLLPRERERERERLSAPKAIWLASSIMQRARWMPVVHV